MVVIYALTRMATPEVFGGGNWLKVARVDARRVDAKVIKRQAFRDRPNLLFPNDAVRQLPAVTPISTSVEAPPPLPAFVQSAD